MSDWIKWCNGGGMVHKTAIIDPTARVGEWARVGEGATMPSALTPKGHCISHVTATDIAVGCNTFPSKWWLVKKNVQDLGKKYGYKPHDIEATIALIAGVHAATKALIKAGILSWEKPAREEHK